MSHVASIPTESSQVYIYDGLTKNPHFLLIFQNKFTHNCYVLIHVQPSSQAFIFRITEAESAFAILRMQLLAINRTLFATHKATDTIVGMLLNLHKHAHLYKQKTHNPK